MNELAPIPILPIEELRSLGRGLLDLSAAWLPTYLAHSTILLGAGVLWIAWRRPAAAIQERLLRFLLVAGLITATVQGVAGLEPVLGRFEIAAGARPATANEAAVVPPAHAGAAGDEAAFAIGAARRAPASSIGSLEIGAPAPAGVAAAPSSLAMRPSPMPSTTEPPRRWAAALAVAWLLAAGLSATLLTVRHRRLRRDLADRWPLRHPELERRLEEMTRQLGLGRTIELMVTPSIARPLSWRIAKPEIVLPRRALDELTTAELETVLAHELAHVARYDPLWQLLHRGLEAALALQPFNRRVRRRLEMLAEMRCDDLAVRLTSRPLELARTLTRVASWPCSVRHGAAANAFAARRGRGLRNRVRRLIADPDGRDREKSTRFGLAAWLVPAIALAAVVLLFAPAFTSGQEPAPPPAPDPPSPVSPAPDSPVPDAPRAPLPVPPGDLVEPDAPSPSVPPRWASAGTRPALPPTAGRPPAPPVPGAVPLPPGYALAPAAPRPSAPAGETRDDLLSALERAMAALRAAEGTVAEREALRELARAVARSLGESDAARAELRAARELRERQLSQAGRERAEELARSRQQHLEALARSRRAQAEELARSHRELEESRKEHGERSARESEELHRRWQLEREELDQSRAAFQRELAEQSRRVVREHEQRRAELEREFRDRESVARRELQALEESYRQRMIELERELAELAALESEQQKEPEPDSPPR